MPSQNGRTVIVSGANSGIGLHTALEMGRHGATVVLACRDPDRGRFALDRVCAAAPGAAFELMLLDLASLDSVRAFADQFAARHGRLDALCNNAGVMAIPRMTTVDGFEMQFGVNHLGHFALTGRLLPLLLATAGSRVVTVASLAHRAARIRLDDLQGEHGYDKWAAYCQSKLANLLFAYELQRRLAASGHSTISVACHPGYAATNLQHVGPRMTGSRFGKAIMSIGNTLLAQSAASGALPTLFALTSTDLRGGEFIGPRGPGRLIGSPAGHRSSRQSYDERKAAMLWQRSVELTGVGYEALRV